MAGSPRFAFIPPSPARGVTAKPVVQTSLDALADSIERRRDGRVVQIAEVEDFELEDRAGFFTAVQIFTLDMSNDRDGLLGTAWLNGKGRETLEPALRQARIRAERKEAA